MLIIFTTVALSTLTLALTIASLWLKKNNSRLQKKLSIAEQDLRQALEDKRIIELTSTKEKEFLQTTIHTLKSTETSWQQSFENLASKIMKESEANITVKTNQLFENFQKHVHSNFTNQEKSMSKVEESLREALTSVNQRIANLTKEQNILDETLKNQNALLIEAQTSFRGQVDKIMHALKTPHVRGQWGEIQLRRIVELAGMEAYCDFSPQQTSHTGEQTVRPDLIINLPEKRHIIVDAKAPLGSYLEGVEATPGPGRDQIMLKHAKNLWSHVQLLSQKKYWHSFSFTPEFVILFLPGESFLSAALDQDPSLLERATRASVIIATPTTLVALLKAVHYGWKNIEISENIKHILDLSSTLLLRIQTFEEHFSKLGKSIENTQSNFQKTARSLESRLLPAAQQLHKIGLHLPADAEQPTETLEKNIDTKV